MARKIHYADNLIGVPKGLMYSPVMFMRTFTLYMRIDCQMSVF